MHLPELLQHLGQGEPVGQDQHLAHQGVVRQRNPLVVQHPLEQILGIHIAHHMVEVSLAHRVGGIGLGGNPQADHGVVVVAQEIGDPFALRHGAGDGLGVELEDVGDGLLLMHGQHTGLGAGFGHGQDVG